MADPGVDLMRRIAHELGLSLALLTESKIRPVTMPLPEDVCERLEGDKGAAVLDAMVRAARHWH